MQDLGLQTAYANGIAPGACPRSRSRTRSGPGTTSH